MLYKIEAVILMQGKDEEEAIDRVDKMALAYTHCTAIEINDTELDDEDEVDEEEEDDDEDEEITDEDDKEVK